MAGLVLGIRVAPIGPPHAPAANPRRIRLLVRSRALVYGEQPGYAYALGGTPEPDDSAPLPARSPTLVLVKDEPVAITVVNHSAESAAVHWHGIELESFPDGVPGWSGGGRSVLDPIAPGDSLTVRFTPPRAGTFMYHSHFDELDQIASGLYGPIVVVNPGELYDADRDRVLLFSDAGPTANVIRGPFAPALLNGRAHPAPMELDAGATYRFRLINVRTDYMVALSLMQHGKPAEWRVVAKDGADLPASQASAGPANLTFAAGEIYDVEFTPRAPGQLTLRYDVPPGGPVSPQPREVAVRVR
jgi:FtsP/CotA-like multicopper oxidase with cupredoxin domain